jgi:hypothetical protein
MRTLIATALLLAGCSTPPQPVHYTNVEEFDRAFASAVARARASHSSRDAGQVASAWNSAVDSSATAPGTIEFFGDSVQTLIAIVPGNILDGGNLVATVRVGAGVKCTPAADGFECRRVK